MSILFTIEIITSLLLIFFILIQKPGQSLNLSSMNSGMQDNKKRGSEKIIHNIITILGIIFILNSILLYLYS